MGFFDELKKLTHPYDDEDDELFDEEDGLEEENTEAPPQQEKRPNPFAGLTFGSKSDPEAKLPSQEKKTNKVVNISAGSGAPQVVLARPERFEAAADIADHLQNNRAVLMNLETTTKDTARRLIDFLSGVAYARGGKIKKVSANTYIITPSNVNLMGDLMDELETTGVYF